MPQITANILKKNFGFNDDAVIQGILRDPGQVARYNKEYQGILNPGINDPKPQLKSALPTADDFSLKQQKQSEGFMQALNAKMASQESLTSASQRIGNELNEPALRKTAFDLIQTLKKIPQNNLALSKKYGMSASSLQKRNAVQQAKIAPQAQEATAQAQFAQAELGRRLGFLLADQQKELQPFYKAQMPLLQERMAYEQSNYSQDKKAELDILLRKMSQDFQLSRDEMARAEDLATREQTFENNLKQIQFGTDEAIREKTALQELKGTGSGSVGTQFERASSARQSAANDARSGWTLSDLQNKYAGSLGVTDIVRIYTANTKYGAPKEAFARQILGLKEPETKKTKTYQPKTINIPAPTPWYKQIPQFFNDLL